MAKVTVPVFRQAVALVLTPSCWRVGLTCWRGRCSRHVVNPRQMAGSHAASFSRPLMMTDLPIPGSAWQPCSGASLASQRYIITAAKQNRKAKQRQEHPGRVTGKGKRQRQKAKAKGKGKRQRQKAKAKGKRQKTKAKAQGKKKKRKPIPPYHRL